MYGYVKANPVCVFEEFGKWVVNERRKAKVDQSYAAYADCAKVIGNSFYGRTIMNPFNFVNTILCDEKTFEKHKCDPFIKDWEEHNEGLFEVTTKKKKVKLDKPIQIGFAILQYAKLKMLQFYYDCLCKYLNFDDIQLMQKDSDSFYYAISEDGYYKLQRIPSGWFPSNDVKNKIGGLTIKDHENFTPGLFKREKEGDEMVTLTHKTYILHSNPSKNIYSLSKTNVDKIFTEDNKTAAKGCQKFNNNLTLNLYKNTLFGERSEK